MTKSKIRIFSVAQIILSDRIKQNDMLEQKETDWVTDLLTNGQIRNSYYSQQKNIESAKSRHKNIEIFFLFLPSLIWIPNPWGGLD